LAWHKLQVIQFWGQSAGILDSGSLLNFHYHGVKGGIREPLAITVFRSRRTRSLWKMRL